MNAQALEAERHKREVIQQHDSAVCLIYDLRNKLNRYESTGAYYMPVKNDDIDLAFAKAINAHPQREDLVSIVRRDHRGAYLIHEKRFTVRLPKSAKSDLMVIVGGGTVTLQHYLSKHLPSAEDKRETRFLKVPKITIDLADGHETQSGGKAFDRIF